MEKWILSFALLFIFVFGGVILTRLSDLSLIAADKSLRAAPTVIFNVLELMLVIAKAVVRVSARVWRANAPGHVVREPRQEVGESGIHVRVNPLNTGNTLGHQPAYRIIGSERRRAPVTIDHSTLD